jgi:hypothetical protein
MTTYKELFGKYVQNVASDPTSTDAEGQIWYNTTSGTFKTVYPIGAWSSGGNVNTGRYRVGTGGTQTDNILFTGKVNQSPVAYSSATESYNGTSWTTLPASMNTSRYGLSGIGLQTAALGFGGISPTNTYLGSTESWNGSSWTSVNSMGTARSFSAAAGIQTAGLVIAGDLPPASSAVESWNGTSWTAAASIPSARTDYPGGSGTQTAAIVYGGGYPNTAETIQYNGTAWSNLPSMATARRAIGQRIGNQSAALAAGGVSTGVTNITEEWTGEVATASSKTLTTS